MSLKKSQEFTTLLNWLALSRNSVDIFLHQREINVEKIFERLILIIHLFQSNISQKRIKRLQNYFMQPGKHF